MVQPRGRERPEAAQRGFLPHLSGRRGAVPPLPRRASEREGTPAFAARDIRTVAAVGTRSDGWRDAAQASSGPRGYRGAESAHALRKPVQGDGTVIPKKHYSNTTRSASTC